MTKICKYCKIEKDLNDFCKTTTKHKNKIYIYFYLCKDCKCLESNKKYHENASYLSLKINTNKLGLTPEWYNNQLKIQNYQCAICGLLELDNKKKLSIDHNHKTGKIRELLCNNCNSSVERFKENVEIIENAIKYLEKYDK